MILCEKTDVPIKKIGGSSDFRYPLTERPCLAGNSSSPRKILI